MVSSGHDLLELEFTFPTDSTISRYRSGKTVPSVESGNINCIAKALAELPDTDLKQEEIYDDLLIAAYEDLELVDYGVFSEKLALLIDKLDINKNKLAEAIHISSSYLSKICKGQAKPTNPVYIAESVSRYIMYNYAQKNHQLIVQQLIWGNIVGYGRFFSDSEYFICLKKWLLSGNDENNNLLENLLRKYESYDVSNFLPYSASLPFDFSPNIDLLRNRDHQLYEGKGGLEKAFFSWINIASSSKSNDTCFLFDDLFAPIARPDYKQFFKYTSAIEQLIKSGKKVIFVHNLRGDLYTTTLKMLVWLPLTMSKHVQNYYLNEPESNMFKHILLTSPEVVMTGYTVNDDYEHGYYYLQKNIPGIMYAKQQAKNLLERANVSSFLYNSRQDYIADLLQSVNRLQDDESLYVYLPAPPLSTMDEKLLKKIIEKNHISANTTERILEQYHRERIMKDNIVGSRSLKVYIDFIDSEKWNTESVPVSFNIDEQEYRLSYDHDDYLQHIESTKEYAKAHENIQLTVEYMNFYKNMIFIFIPDKYGAAITFDDHPVIAGSHQQPIVASIDKLLYIINPKNEKEVLKNPREKEILNIFKRLTAK